MLQSFEVLSNSLNLFGVEFELNKKYTVENPHIAEDIIAQMYRHICRSLDITRFSSQGSMYWNTISRLTPHKTACFYNGRSSKFLTQLVAAFRIEHNIKISAELKAELGNLLSQSSFSTLTFDFTQDFDWNAGDFGDEGSCFFNGRRHARNRIKSANGFAIRFYHPDSGHGIGRAWGFWDKPEFKGRLLIFNVYGASVTEYAQRIKNIFLHFGITLGYDRPYVEFNGKSGGLIYQNSTNILFYNSATDTEYVQETTFDSDGDKIAKPLDVDIDNYHFICAVSGKRSDLRSEVSQVHPRYFGEDYSLARDIANEQGFFLDTLEEVLMKKEHLVEIRRYVRGSIQVFHWQKDLDGLPLYWETNDNYYDISDGQWYNGVSSTIIQKLHPKVALGNHRSFQPRNFQVAFPNVERKTRFNPATMARYLTGEYPEPSSNWDEDFEKVNGVGVITVDTLEDFFFCFLNMMPARLNKVGQNLSTNGLVVWFNSQPIARNRLYHLWGRTRDFVSYCEIVSYNEAEEHLKAKKHNKGKPTPELGDIVQRLYEYMYIPVKRNLTKVEAWWKQSYRHSEVQMVRPDLRMVKKYSDIRLWETDERCLKDIIQSYKDEGAFRRP